MAAIKRIHPVLLFVLFFNVSVFAQEEPVQSDPVLRIGYIADLGQVLGMDGSKAFPFGFATELLTEIAELEEIRLEWIPASWNNLFPQLLSGEVDGVPNITDTRERRQILQFPDEYLFLTWSTLYVLDHYELESMIQLHGARVGLVQNDQNSAGFKQYIESFEIFPEYIQYSSFDEAAKALLNGKILGFAGAAPELFNIDFPGFRSSGIYFNPNKLSIAFSSSTDPVLVDKISQRLVLLKQDPDSLYYRLVDQYGLRQWRTWRRPIPVWVVFLMILLVCLIFGALLVAFLFRRQVKIKSGELLQEEIKLDSAADLASLGYLEIDFEKNTLLLSHQAVIISGMTVTPEQPLPIRPIIRMLAPDERKGLLREFLTSQQERREFRVLYQVPPELADSTHRWLEVKTIHQYRNGRPSLSFGVIQNVTDWVSAQEELQAKEQQLQHAQKMESIGLLAGGIAHDFNNMLGAILGLAELIQLELGDQSDSGEHARQIVSTAGRAADLTQQLLTFARKGISQFNPVDLHDVVSAVVTIAERTFDKTIEITSDLGALQPCVFGDDSLLQSALLNLLINSRDALPEGGNIHFKSDMVRLSQGQCDASSFELEPGIFVKLTLEDNGCGIHQDQLNHIFDPFFTTKKVGKGTGLGLAAVYGTVVDHKGAVYVYSSPGSGSRFEMLFPVSTEPCVGSSIVKTESAAGLSGLTALIVDDEPSVRTMTEANLRKVGMNTLTASDGLEGIRMFRSRHHEIDVVVLDVVLPELGGLEVMKQMKEIKPDVRVLVISGYTKDQSVNALLQAGARAFLKKPFRRTDLCDSLAAILL